MEKVAFDPGDACSDATAHRKAYPPLAPPTHPRSVVGKHADKRIVIEVDGPVHFEPRPPFRPLTHTVFRNRLLEYHGWTVISIPFYEWVPLRSIAAKQEYMRRKLGPLVADRGGGGRSPQR